MAAEEWFVQHNFKVGDDLVNLRGRNVEHLLENVREYASVIGELAQLKANLAGGQALAPVVQPQQQAAPQAAPQQQFQQQPSASWGQPPQQAAVPQVRLHPEGKTCSCGRTLEYKEINRKSDGKQFRMWSCPAQQKRGDGHDSEFVN